MNTRQNMITALLVAAAMGAIIYIVNSGQERIAEKALSPRQSHCRDILFNASRMVSWKPTQILESRDNDYVFIEWHNDNFVEKGSCKFVKGSEHKVESVSLDLKRGRRFITDELELYALTAAASTNAYKR